jgi:hypothetical protein
MSRVNRNSNLTNEATPEKGDYEALGRYLTSSKPILIMASIRGVTALLKMGKHDAASGDDLPC